MKPNITIRPRRARGNRRVTLSGACARVAAGSWGLAIVSLAPQASPALQANARSSNASFRFDVLGTANLNCVLQSATNIGKANWLDVVTNLGRFSFTSPMSTNGLIKCFRTVCRP